MKSIRFLIEDDLLSEVDGYKSRYISRTQIIEAALRAYLRSVAANGGKLIGVGGWSV
jgi:metal-responsive CopG/Arc/MetJ family transcriptional regulator